MYNKLVYKYQVTEEGLTFNVELAGKSKEDVKIFREDYSIAINVNDNKYRISYEDYLLRSKRVLVGIIGVEEANIVALLIIVFFFFRPGC